MLYEFGVLFVGEVGVSDEHAGACSMVGELVVPDWQGTNARHAVEETHAGKPPGRSMASCEEDVIDVVHAVACDEGDEFAEHLEVGTQRRCGDGGIMFSVVPVGGVEVEGAHLFFGEIGGRLADRAELADQSLGKDGSHGGCDEEGFHSDIGETGDGGRCVVGVEG